MLTKTALPVIPLLATARVMSEPTFNLFNKVNKNICTVSLNEMCLIEFVCTYCERRFTLPEEPIALLMDGYRICELQACDCKLVWPHHNFLCRTCQRIAYRREKGQVAHREIERE
jgi:hypothetical protein